MKSRAKVIVFGDLPLASKVVQDLLERPNVTVVGVVIGNRCPKNVDPWDEVPPLAEFTACKGLREFSLKELEDTRAGELTLGLSCRFSRILKPEVLKCFSVGVVNFHGGLLPEMGGLFSSCHSILLGEQTGGGTLHFIDKGVDTGDIIRRAEFPIGPHDTSYDVFCKTQRAIFEAYMEVIPAILRGDAPRIRQLELTMAGKPTRYFSKSSLEGRKEIAWNATPEAIYRTVRAFDFPGHEPAYLMLGDRKIYLSTRSN